MKNFIRFSVLAMVIALGPFASANVYNVTNTIDGVGAVFSVGGTSFNASTLRAAVNAANAVAGPHTVNLPPGTYTLTLGELPVGTNANLIVTINGTGTPANTIVQHDTAASAARVFNLDGFLSGGVNVTIQNITIAHGRNNDGIGGAGIVCGFQGPPAADSTTLSNCVLLDNLVVASTPDAVGGGLQNIGGTLKVFSCRFDGNSSSNFSGGAIYYDSHSPSTGTCQIVNCVFTNNSCADPSSGGGAIFISGVTGSTLSVSNSLFSANKVTSSSGSGGALIKFGGAPLIVSGCTFTNNQVLGNSAIANNSSGGAIDNGGGPMTIVYSRFFQNTTAAVGHGNAVNVASASGASLAGDNNWWGINTGPGASDLVGASVATWLRLSHYASPASIPEVGSTTLIASVLTNSAGTAIPAGNLGVLIGLPVTFGNAVGGSISSPQPVIQASGTATATFTMSVGQSHTADATVDAATATAVIGVICPTITGTLTGSAAICQGNSTNISVSVSGGVAPYSVTLNNGGGTLVGSSPLIFPVSPSSTTTYAVSSATDAFGCPATISGSATITVNPASATITPTPSSVCANSTGNQASGPAGQASYAWTIANGVITSATNIQTITYSAGASGSVTLGLAVTNSSGCSGSGFLGVPINPPPAPTITPSPGVVLANSPGNQASAPAGYSSYAWTISNGVLSSAANGNSVTYIAGPFGNVTLNLTVVNAIGCSGGTSIAVPIIPAAASPAGASFRTNYFSGVSFTDALSATTIGLAFDGTNYWSCSGGGQSGVRYAQYDSNGVMVATFSPGLDFRSVFVQDGVVFGRAFSDRTIYRQSAPGTFVASGVTLVGGALDSQSAVVLSGSGTEYIAMSGGVVSRWDLAGNFIGTVPLQGFGGIAGENVFAQNRGVAALGDFWLTYNGTNILSVWDTTGSRLARITLSGAGTSFDSGFSLSYCNGKAFVVSVAGGVWRGFDVGSAGRVAVYGAPSTTNWNADVQNKILGAGQIPQVDASLVTAGFPVPALAELQRYESVLVYSDDSFNNSTILGNNLADYVDLGGGVVLNTFAFYNSGGLDIEGRLVTGNYLPLTTGADQTDGTVMTLVEDQPSHSIFTNVSSFNGGTSSYHNSPISIAAGATLLGHWTDGQPLVGVKEFTLGRTVGLNFYPPSSDVRNDFWVSSTDGARLMANALLYAGKVPPVIMMAPSNSVAAVGHPVSFGVTVAGLPPLTYQWRRNGTNIAGATASTLSFPMLATSAGFYTVVVSNSYGLAVCSKAVLNLPLRVLPPTLGPGRALTLFVTSSDGIPLTLDRALSVRIYSTTNIATALNNWIQSSAPLSFSNGLVRVDGIMATNSTEFYRAAEAP